NSDRLPSKIRGVLRTCPKEIERRLYRTVSQRDEITLRGEIRRKSAIKYFLRHGHSEGGNDYRGFAARVRPAVYEELKGERGDGGVTVNYSRKGGRIERCALRLKILVDAVARH